MFEIKINENEYYVFAENELNIIGPPTSTIIACPNYYDLKVINGNKTLIIFTNNEPVIINKNKIDIDNPFRINISFGYPLTAEEYNTLYEINLNQIDPQEKEEENNIKKYIKKNKPYFKN